VSADIEFGLLGPLLVRRSGITLPALPGKQRVVLAALLLRANQMVSLDELSEVMWGPEPPASALGTLRNYVKELRKAMDGGARPRISTLPGGYQIELTDAELDLRRFDALRTCATTSASAGAWHEASQQLRAALALWRGEPLADVPSELLAAREVSRLAELRLQAAVAWVDADLHLGRHKDVIAGLRQLTAVHPFRERLHAQLMLALYRDGQQAQALDTYHRARGALLDELGVEPGPELRLLYRRILRADPALMDPAASEAGRATAPAALAARPPAPAVPHQLPAPARHFTGRTAELEALTRMLGSGTDGARTVPLVAITGSAGVGKTAMAILWAHRMADRFPGGQLYVDLRGYDAGEPLPVTAALAGFIRALGVAGQDLPDAAAERPAMYRSLLSGRRVLVLIDNARSAEQARSLLPGTPGCAAIVTSRDALTGLVAREGAQRLELGVLPADDAAELLRALIGARAQADREATRRLAAQCSWLPLALRVAAELAAARPGISVAALASELADQSMRLDLLDAGGDDRTAIRTVFSWSCRHLDPAAARTFRLLGLHPGGDFGAYATAALTGSAVGEARRLLGTLIRAYLIQPVRADRLGLHDLLRAYAVEQAARQHSQPDRDAAILRLLDFYLHTSHAAGMLLNPARDPLGLRPPQPGVTVAPIASRDSAMSWFETEHHVLHAAIAQAAASDLGTHAWQLANLLAMFLNLRGFRPESIEVMRTALAAAERADDVPGQAHTLCELGGALVQLARHQEADACLRRASRLSERLGDQAGQARAQMYLGVSCERMDQYQEALGHAQQALSLFRAARHLPGQARALNHIGWDYAHLGRQRRALNACLQAVGMNREVGDLRGEGATWDSLGYSHSLLGHYDQAITCYQHAVNLANQAANRYQAAEALTKLGDVLRAAGNPEAAGQAWRLALDRLDEPGHPQADRIRSRLVPADSAGPSGNSPQSLPV
jgi:DNA-binding SARP family transcriptional activator